MSSSQPLPQRRTSNHPKIPRNLEAAPVELRVPGVDLSGGFASAAQVVAAAALRGAAGPDPRPQLLTPDFTGSLVWSPVFEGDEPC